MQIVYTQREHFSQHSRKLSQTDKQLPWSHYVIELLHPDALSHCYRIMVCIPRQKGS